LIAKSDTLNNFKKILFDEFASFSLSGITAVKLRVFPFVLDCMDAPSRGGLWTEVKQRPTRGSKDRSVAESLVEE
jgi:hypothetical protein